MADMTRVGMRVRGAEVVTVPIDDTLTIEGQAADAKAVGDALAQKADKSELQAAIQVNGQPADAQGLILIDGRHIPVSDQDAETLAVAVTDLKGKTAENIPMSSDSGAKTIAEVVNENAEAIASMEGMTAETMPMAEGSQETVKSAIDTLNQKAVKTVNQKEPDAEGNVDLSVVPLAENLQSEKMQNIEGTFAIRTTGGKSSVSDGKAYPQHLIGTAERTGYVAEELNMTVIPITRTEPDEPITATIDRDVFVAYVDESGTINLYYTTEWSEDPELYGVTVEGTPVAGDQIQIVYVKEQRGTILVSNPGRLVGTGWNLFNFNAGYARVVRYSDEYGYKIGGAFTSIEYSTIPEGDRVSILPGQNGLFQVPGDGYVFVNGGNATDTYILATWSDWTDGPATGYWEAYKESGIDLSAVMGTYFPYGLLSVGNIHDEIDLSAKRTISRVERMAYTAENLEAAIETGREYTYDTNYIYLERAESVISAITIDTVYNVSEHGLEWFTETAMPLITEILYGKNLRDKLERDVLTISEQTLAEEEKAQVRRNIGVMDPPTNGYGTAAQLLKTNGDGTTEWTTQGTPTDAQVGTAVSAWLTAHPEATTTVQDGAISRAKLNDDLKDKTDAVPELKSRSDTQNPFLFSEKIPYGQEITYQYSKLPIYKKGAYINNSGVIKTNASVTANILVLPTRGIKRIGIVATADQAQYSNAYVVFIKPDGTLYNVALKGNAMTSADTEYYIELNRWVFDYNTLMLINWIGVTGDTFVTNDSINIEYYAQSEWEMNLPLKESFSEYVDIYTPCLPVYQTGKYMKRDGTLGNQAGARIVSISPELIDKIEITFDPGHSTYPAASTPFAVLVNRKGTSIDALFPNTYGAYSVDVNHDEMDGGTIYINLYDANNWYHEWKTSGGSDIFTTYHMKAYRRADKKFLPGNYIKRPFDFAGKKVAYIGDSITYGTTVYPAVAENPWPKLFSESVGVSENDYVNYADPGACFYDPTNPGKNSMLEQLQSISNTPDYIFIAGGTNDWLFATSFANFTSAVDAVITYIKTNFPEAKVIFITPINQGGYAGSHYNDHIATIQKYRDLITQEVITNDNGNFSIIQGNSFNFPDSNADPNYIAAVFADNLHPSELGYRTVYLTNLLQRLC